MLSRSATKKSAFSLIELSIVLVILGLLTGGILAGQSLIRASELRAVSTESQRYITALSSFRDKYFAIPGDFSNASGFGWGSYNGNANGTIDMSTTAGSNEISTAWIHLANAGLVEGSYTNVVASTTSTSGTMTAGTNNPRSKMNNAGWNIWGLGSVAAASTIYYPNNYSNALFFGGGSTFGGNAGPSGIMKSEEAWNVDTKMDDGKPETGTITALESQAGAAGAGCGLSPAGTNNFDLQNTSAIACSLVIKSGY
jgi:prepilin-type N-terminal cleavage/methylation domain-containing protein